MTAPLTAMRPPTQAQALPKTELRPGLSSPEVGITNGTQDVNLDRGVKTGMALPDAAGIEIDRDRVIRTEEFEFERFMNEVVTVQMMPPSNENDHQFAEVTVNGQYACLTMGDQHDIPRKHLAALAQAKSLRIDQKKIANPDGSIGFKETAVMRQMYPFQVVHDPNPRGVSWLMQLLKNPG